MTHLITVPDMQHVRTPPWRSCCSRWCQGSQLWNEKLCQLTGCFIYTVPKNWLERTFCPHQLNWLVVLALCRPCLGIKNVRITSNHRMLDGKEFTETFLIHSYHATNEETKAQPDQNICSGTLNTIVNYCFGKKANAGTSSPTAFLTFSVTISGSRRSAEWHCILSKSRQEFEKLPMVQLLIA